MRYSEADLILADRQVAKAEEHVAKQRAIIRRLASHGHDTGLAEQLLIQFEAGLHDHIALRELIRSDCEEVVATG